MITAGIQINGIVQGVGFRPFVYRLANAMSMDGWIRNSHRGVEIQVTESREKIDEFIARLEQEAPPLAVIDDIRVRYTENPDGAELKCAAGGSVEAVAEGQEQETPEELAAGRKVKATMEKLLRERADERTNSISVGVLTEGQEQKTPEKGKFRIIESDAEGPMETWISPDTAICPDCLREMRNPSDRRYRFPFINCTNCGPRFTIIKGTPYDRSQTTMADFRMCPECAAEYSDPLTRRYHAQPDCCPECGPWLTYVTSEDSSSSYRVNPQVSTRNCVTSEDSSNPYRERADSEAALSQARKDLLNGKIVAVKGLGGFHLAALADNPETCARLRKRKHRDEKPFAIMCADAESAKAFAYVSEDEKRLLESPARPIVLLRKKRLGEYGWISENNYIGVMLPYTPVHYLLFEEGISALVMTSANLSDRPIIYKNQEALDELAGIADGFLLHNREIETRCDDSLVWCVNGEKYFARRSRGYVPMPVLLPEEPGGILACGAEQKASFMLTRRRYGILSQHIGDLKNLETFENYEAQIEHFEEMFGVRAGMIACDLHPDYMSSVYARERGRKEGIEVIAVQHHHAHMASCMADNNLSGKCIGIIWDGTGAGGLDEWNAAQGENRTSGSIWGGEFLVGDYSGYKRAGTIRPVKLAGGDKAVREIWRVGCALTEDAGTVSNGALQVSSTEMTGEAHTAGIADVCEGIFTDVQRNTVSAILKAGINCPESSGMGRLFDGVAAILGIKDEASYEGQGAVLLEAAAQEEAGGSGYICRPYSYEILTENGMWVFDYREMISEICRDKDSGMNVGLIATGFMETLISMAVDMCERIRKENGTGRVVLSGGTFQNMFLLKGLSRRLEEAGFDVYRHHRVSTNDEGICLGQAAIAAEAREIQLRKL